MSWRSVTPAENWNLNSATAQRRGEHEWPQCVCVQERASIRPRLNAVENPNSQSWLARPRPRLQFGHGSTPWRTIAEQYDCEVRHDKLQFGHGSAPWRTTTPTKRSCRTPERRFNSATAQHRGELQRLHARCRRVIKASIRPRHQHVENNIDASDIPPSIREASIRPRHQHVENTRLPSIWAAHQQASIRPRHQHVENLRQTS